MGFIITAPCRNCGTMTPVGEMLRNEDGQGWDCTRCPGERWLWRNWGEQAVADLVALREHRPGAPTLGELVASYPARRGGRRKAA